MGKKKENPVVELPAAFTNKSTYGVSAEELIEASRHVKIDWVLEQGNVEELAGKLKTDLQRGLTSAEAKSQTRIEHFGINYVAPPESAGFFKLCLEALNDQVMILLSICAVISIILGLPFIATAIAELDCGGDSASSGCGESDHENGWIEGVAILVAVVIVVLVTAGNDWQKERQFQKLNQKKTDRNIMVRRNGNSEQIKIAEVVVGDVCEIKTGDVLPADGLFIEGQNFKINESDLTGEPHDQNKDYAVRGMDPKDEFHPVSPFFFGSTQVNEGLGLMLVINVGPYTRAAIEQEYTPPEPTPLQNSLDKLANQIGLGGMISATVLLVALIIKYIIIEAGNDTPFSWGDFGTSVLAYIITAITIVVVAVPEGLPLAVTIALAYSMLKMLKDNNLVRKLEACETMGRATIVASDKTGTLTKNEMTVVTGFINGHTFDEADIPNMVSGSSALLGGKIDGEPVFDIVAEGMAVNSTADEVVDTQTKSDALIWTGSTTEQALLKWGQKMSTDFSYKKYRASVHDEGRNVHAVLFTSDRKRSSQIISMGGKRGELRLYCKGAAEMVMRRCSYVLVDNEVVGWDESGLDDAIKAKQKEMTEDALRVLCIAYKPVDEPRGGWEAAVEDDTLEQDLIFIGLAGIEDPIRDEVPDAVKSCQEAGVRVLMVTGDNVDTARNIAKRANILTAGGLVIEGNEFAALNTDDQVEVCRRLQVMARSMPLHKKQVVKIFKEHLDEIVAVTGDGTNDAPALNLSHVGFAMGQSGTEVARNASDIILMDDNFASIVKALAWGRNVYDSIRKFVQFQLTVNIVAVLVAFVGSVSDAESESPLKAVQLLWVNLIMDTLAALALATDEPTDELLERKPIKTKSSLISNLMWMHIIGQSIYQVIVMFVLLYGGWAIFDLDSDDADDRLKLFTIIFNAFVWCQLFNELNCRKIAQEINIFKGMFKNVLFVGIFIGTAVIQFLFVQFGGDFSKTTALNFGEWMICLAIGVVSLIIGLALRFVNITDNTLQTKDFMDVDLPDIDHIMGPILKERAAKLASKSGGKKPVSTSSARGKHHAGAHRHRNESSSSSDHGSASYSYEYTYSEGVQVERGDVRMPNARHR